MWLNLYGRQAVRHKLKKGLKMHLCQLIWPPLYLQTWKKFPLKQTNFKELVTGWSISYKSIKQFRLNLLLQMAKYFCIWNGKTFSHLQMDIFCHFNFCYNRRNGFLHHFHPYLSHKVHNAYVKHYCSKWGDRLRWRGG